MALGEWLNDGREPPPSRYPRIADGTLVDWRAKASGWAPLPGVRYPAVIQQPELLDYGPEFYTQGIIGRHPPRRLGSYRVLVPAHDADNNEQGMLFPPSVAVPAATYTGWNLRHRNGLAAGTLWLVHGSYLPFARDAAERSARGDPRRSISERYPTRARYIAAFERLSIMTYASRFKNVTADTFKPASSPQVEADRARIAAAIARQNDSDVTLDYQLQRRGDEWKIINIIADGVSDLALKRAEYQRLFSSGGLEGLIAELERQAGRLEGG